MPIVTAPCSFRVMGAILPARLRVLGKQACACARCYWRNNVNSRSLTIALQGQGMAIPGKAMGGVWGRESTFDARGVQRLAVVAGYFARRTAGSRPRICLDCCVNRVVNKKEQPSVATRFELLFKAAAKWLFPRPAAATLPDGAEDLPVECPPERLLVEMASERRRRRAV